MNAYIGKTLENLKRTIPWEKEFIQSVIEVFETIEPAISRNDQYQKHGILERLVVPERSISFRVPWVDDNGNVQVNNGYRVQFNSTLGPYKGGLRFHSSVSLSSLKFLGFEQIFKNSLTGLPMGAGKGGSDFSLKGKSENEIMRFCQSFMTELQRHISPSTDVPAGDIGVGGREIGYLAGKYKAFKRGDVGMLTGKGMNWGGSKLRPQATGFGNIYFANEMLKSVGESMAGKRVAVSGFGNVSWGTVTKATEMGAKVVTLSGPDGYIYDPDGVSGEKIDYMLEMRNMGNDCIKDYADKFGVEFFEGRKPWEVKVDIACPCAIQNELDEKDAQTLVDNGCHCVSEGANMPCLPGAVDIILNNKLLYGPGKAANAGGVSVSGLEMAQNTQGSNWEAETVDAQLKEIMTNIHTRVKETAEEFDAPGNYVLGANIAGFKRVADEMIKQGVV